MSKKANFPAKLEQLREMLAWISSGLESVSFDQKALHKIELASEEALVNVIKHAYQERPENIEIHLKIFPTHVEVLIKDKGPAFNPLDVEVKIDSSLSVEERSIGGLGIHLMRECMDEVKYRREGNANLLSLIKKISA